MRPDKFDICINGAPASKQYLEHRTAPLGQKNPYNLRKSAGQKI
jgi:hypothetical protein